MTRADREHLRILSICHYVLSGLCFLIGCIPLIHLAIGIAIVTGQMGPGQPPEFFGWFFIGISAVVILFHWGLSVALVIAGRSLAQRKRRTLCLVVAGASCLMQPLGVVLGVFTFIVLLRPSVRDAFEPVPEEPEEPSEFDRYHSDET